MQRLGRHLCITTGYRKSRHYPHLYYRRLARRGYYGVVEFKVIEATEDYIQVACLLSLVALEVHRVAEEIFGFKWEEPHLVKHGVWYSEPMFIDPRIARRQIWTFPLKAGLWARLKDILWHRALFMWAVRRSINIFFSNITLQDLLDVSTIPDDPYGIDLRDVLASLMILGRRGEGLALLEEYMQTPNGKKYIGSFLLGRKRYAEYIYTPRYPH